MRKTRADKSKTGASRTHRADLVTKGRRPQGPRTTLTTIEQAVIERAVEMGLMTANTQQVGARLPVGLLEQAKTRTGIVSTTDLLAFALANIAVEDHFAAAFVAARGKLDPDLDVGF